MKTKYILGLSTAAALALATTSQAITSEGFRVSFDNGANWVTQAAVNDNTLGDLNPANDSMLVNFTFNNLTFSIIVTGNGNGNGVSSPKLDLSVGGTMLAGTSVIVEFSANGFTPPSTGSYNTSVTVNGTPNAYSVTETTRVGVGASGNDLYADGGNMAAIGPLTPVSSGSSSGLAPDNTGNPYSITISEVITTGREDVQLSIDTHVRVPDGGNTMLLLGSALSVVGGLGLLRKKAVKA